MNDVVFSLLMLGALSGGEGLPFWATANSYGLMPEYGNCLVSADVHRDFDPQKTFQLHWGLSGAAVAERGKDIAVLPDQLYAGFRWKTMRMDAGMMHRERAFVAADPSLGSLSATEGHFVENGNARTMPGVLLSLEPTAVPLTGGKLKISGAFGDYSTLDRRYVQGTLVHRTRGYLSYEPTQDFKITIGLDHYCQWGGTHPEFGAMPIDLDNYLRVITGRSGAAGWIQMDRANGLGNQGGAELVKIDWKTRSGSFTFQLEKPYEDKSGMVLWNFPDGDYTLAWECPGEQPAWLTGLLMEFQYTKWQSGSIHDKETDDEGNQIMWRPGLNFVGGDEYFNNGFYMSGWTHYGRTIGNPLFTVGECGIANNRLRAFHCGATGYLFGSRQMPYRLMLTFSQNFGTYEIPLRGEGTWQKEWHWWQKNPYDVAVPQLSAAFTGYVSGLLHKDWLSLTYGLYADAGKLLGNRAGAVLGIRCNLGR